MDFTDPTKEIVTSYFSANDFEKQIAELSAKLTKDWVQYMGDTLNNVLARLEEDDQKGAQEAFLDAISDAEKQGEKMATQIGEMVAKQVGETFHIAYNEGASAAQSLEAKTLRKLIADGSIEDPNGSIEHFLQVSAKHHEEYMNKMMKGKHLNVYSVDKRKPKEDK